MNGPNPGTCPGFRAKRQLRHAAVVSPPAPPPVGEGSVVSRLRDFPAKRRTQAGGTNNNGRLSPAVVAIWL